MFEASIAGNDGLPRINVRPQFLQARGDCTPYLTRTRVIWHGLEAYPAPPLIEGPGAKQPEAAIHQDDQREHRIAGGR